MSMTPQANGLLTMIVLLEPHPVSPMKEIGDFFRPIRIQRLLFLSISSHVDPDSERQSDGEALDSKSRSITTTLSLVLPLLHLSSELAQQGLTYRGTID